MRDGLLGQAFCLLRFGLALCRGTWIFYNGLDRGVSERFEEFEGLGSDVAVMLGPYQQIYAPVAPLLVEHLEEIRFSVADANQARVRYFPSQLNDIT